VANPRGTFVLLRTLVALSRVSDRDAGLAASLPNVGQQVGGSIGLALLGTVAWTVMANTARSSAVSVAAAARAREQAAAKLRLKLRGSTGLPVARVEAARRMLRSWSADGVADGRYVVSATRS
jgi:hypothetical protein